MEWVGSLGISFHGHGLTQRASCFKRFVPHHTYRLVCYEGWENGPAILVSLTVKFLCYVHESHFRGHTWNSDDILMNTVVTGYAVSKCG